MKRVSAIQANLIAVIEPVFNPVWVFVVIGEAPGTHALIGGGIIVLAVTITSIISARRREEVGGSNYCGPKIQPGDEKAMESIAGYIVPASFSQERH